MWRVLALNCVVQSPQIPWWHRLVPADVHLPTLFATDRHLRTVLRIPSRPPFKES